MELKMGEKIRTLRKARDISQEVLAQALGVTFQAVSKWETGSALPDVTLIPAIAGFFGVSTDELFDVNMLEQERLVEDICNNAFKYRFSDPDKAEEILREGLKRFPGNEIILNNLLVEYTVQGPERNDDIIALCKSILEIARLDDVRYDVLRILAETYKATGQQALVAPTLEQIPELYFTKLGCMAELLEGNESLDAAKKQLGLDLESMINMLLIIAERQHETGDNDDGVKYRNIATRVLAAFKSEDCIHFIPAPFEDYLKEKLVKK